MKNWKLNVAKMSLDWSKRNSLLSTCYILGVKNTIPIWVFLGSILILSLEKIVWRTYMLLKPILNLKWSYVRGQKVKRTSFTLSYAVFSFWWVQKKRFSQRAKFVFTFSWSIWVTAIVCLFHTAFKMERQTLMVINNSNRDLYFW